MIFILLLVQYQRSISLFYLLIIKGNIMKKNTIVSWSTCKCFFVSLLAQAGIRVKLLLSVRQILKNAAEVIKYYNTSLGVLKDMVKEKDVNAVLDYMEQKEKPRLFLPLFLRPLFQKTRQ